jgi:hypothetical protein
MFVAEQIGLPVDVHLESPDLADAFDEQAVRRKLTSIESVRGAARPGRGPAAGAPSSASTA